MANDIRHKKQWTADDVRTILALIDTLNVQSLDAKVTTIDGDIQLATVGDFVIDPKPNPEELVELDDRRRFLLNIVDELPPNQRQIIVLRYGLVTGQPKTLDEVGKMYGVTRERIRQVEMRALERLKWLLKFKYKCRDMNDV